MKLVNRLSNLIAARTMPKKKHPSMPLPSLSEVRPNSGQPTDWAVSHQSPFPWLNTIAFLPATDAMAKGPDLVVGPALEV